MASQASRGNSPEDDGQPRLEVVTEDFQPPQPAVPSTDSPSPNPAVIFGVLRAIAMVLAVRLLLLSTLLVAGTLAVKAMNNPTWMTLAVLAIYCVLVVLPMAWLERSKK